MCTLPIVSVTQLLRIDVSLMKQHILSGDKLTTTQTAPLIKCFKK